MGGGRERSEGEAGLTWKMLMALLRRDVFFSMLRSSGAGKSGVSERSLRPYLWGLSSGSGDGAGMVGDSAESRSMSRRGERLADREDSCCVRTGDSPGDCDVRLASSSSSASPSCKFRFSRMRDSRPASLRKSITVPDELSGLRGFCSVTVVSDGDWDATGAVDVTERPRALDGSGRVFSCVSSTSSKLDEAC